MTFKSTTCHEVWEVIWIWVSFWKIIITRTLDNDKTNGKAELDPICRTCSDGPDTFQISARPPSFTQRLLWLPAPLFFVRILVTIQRKLSIIFSVVTHSAHPLRIWSRFQCDGWWRNDSDREKTSAEIRIYLVQIMWFNDESDQVGPWNVYFGNWDYKTEKYSRFMETAYTNPITLVVAMNIYEKI